MLCLLPAKALPEVPLWDKLEHFLAYALLAAAGGLAYPNRHTRLWIVLFLLVLGVGIEFSQGFVPRRDSSALDMLANAIGVLIGIFVTAPFSVIMRRARTASRIHGYASGPLLRRSAEHGPGFGIRLGISGKVSSTSSVGSCV